MKTSYNNINSQAASNRLAMENHDYDGTGGVSKNNYSMGFTPAFLDADTGNIYRSCFANGLPAPIHIISGLPQSILNSIVSGFLLNDIFYTREEAATALENMH